MVKLKPGDRILCKVNNGNIAAPYEEEYQEILSFEIIAKDDYGYSLYIPHYIYLRNCVVLDKSRIKDWKVNKKFLGENCLYIREGMVYKIDVIMDGCICIKCNEFCNQAEPNQPDGTLICWYCKNYPNYKLIED